MRSGPRTPASGTAWVRRSRSGPWRETPEAGAPSIVVDGSGAPIVAYTVGGHPTRGAGGGANGGTLAHHPRRHPLGVRSRLPTGDEHRPSRGRARRGRGRPSLRGADRGAAARRHLDHRGRGVRCHRRRLSRHRRRHRGDLLLYGVRSVASPPVGPGSWSIEEVASVAKADGGDNGRHHGRGPAGHGVAVDGQGTHLGGLAGRRGHPSRVRRRGQDRRDRDAGHGRRREPDGGGHRGRRFRLPRLVRPGGRRPPARHLRGDLRPEDRGPEPRADGR